MTLSWFSYGVTKEWSLNRASGQEVEQVRLARLLKYLMQESQGAVVDMGSLRDMKDVLSSFTSPSMVKEKIAKIKSVSFKILKASRSKFMIANCLEETRDPLKMPWYRDEAHETIIRRPFSTKIIGWKKCGRPYNTRTEKKSTLHPRKAKWAKEHQQTGVWNYPSSSEAWKSDRQACRVVNILAVWWIIISALPVSTA